MTDTKICPVTASNLSDHGRQYSLRQFLDNWEDYYESNYRNNPDYWHARRAFLSSYHFSEEIGTKDKLKRSAKEIKETVIGVVTSIREEVSKRRIGIKVFKFTLGLPSLMLGRLLREQLSQLSRLLACKTSISKQLPFLDDKLRRSVKEINKAVI
ncbi:unnamed protein product [Dovyalis caffra]|uniref:Ribosomal protein S3 n=1 Tax=Dovyalis caffra TaxID=77055 RepID=A0AAV1QPG6_9ROSI|nr:unnamed protein product [Dovyalis caffra]